LLFKKALKVYTYSRKINDFEPIITKIIENIKYDCVEIGYENNKINAKITCNIFILYLRCF